MKHLKPRRSLMVTGTALCAMALAISGCGNNATTGTAEGTAEATVVDTETDVVEVESPATEATEGEATAAAPAAGTHEIDCSAYDQFGDISGEHVSVYTSIVEAEAESQIASYKAFEDCTGAIIDYEGSREFEAQLLVRLQAGNHPDIAYMPQPGLLATVVRDFPNVVYAAPEAVVNNVDTGFSEAWKGYGTVDGTFYAAPLGSNVKSFVWYSPSAFAEHGYEVPETWDEMIALTDQMVADTGGPVWCAGVESGDATGWPGTDWIEDVMLRTAGPEKYQEWYEHTIPFNDPSVITAFDTTGEILLNNERVNAGLGDAASIATTPWTDAGFGLLDGTCLLHRAANFYGAQLPAGTNIGPDGDVYAFYLPTNQTDIRPVLGGGEFVLAMSDRPAVQAFQTYLSSADWANEKALATPDGGWVNANKGLNVDNLSTSIDKLSAETLQDPHAVIAFDASDLMPGQVGAGTFWTGIVNWLTGTPTQQVVDTIEQSWPTN